MTETTEPGKSFADFDLIAPVQQALQKVGYENPTPIQEQIIPIMLEGMDVIGQAQTGTGKTAAFALPILSRIDLKQKKPQVLVLAPTRELAIQVAEAFQRYAGRMKGFHVLPVYGGADIRSQFRALDRGVHVVVGTPGRVMDHMRRGSLDLSELSCLVLDEADEMLRMGFIDDVEWILEQTPNERQITLFSATMPPVIRRIAQKHLQDPKEITIKDKTTTADTIRQRFWIVSGVHKLDALTRILEAETFDAILIFVRTRVSTVNLAEKLAARGYSAAALNGDLSQANREKTVRNLKKGQLDILVATDVAARGLDLDRISHVINFDVPYDTESYVHRIGRTGRAGRSGEAILFISPREKNMLRSIERATRQKIEKMVMPTTRDINDQRIANFKQSITDTLAKEELGFYEQLIEKFTLEHNVPALDVASALAKMVHGKTPLLVEKASRPEPRFKENEGGWKERPARKPRSGPAAGRPEEGMERYRLEVGHCHEVKPGQIVGAIANEAGLDGKDIGAIDIREDHSTVDLPEGMPDHVYRILQKARVAGQRLNLSLLKGFDSSSRESAPPRHKKKFTPRGDAPGGKPGFAGKGPKSAPKKHRKGPPKVKKTKD